jgi:hypothetical protein
VAQFKGLHWGIGIGVSIDRSGGTPVDEVEVIADTVRVTETKTSVPRLLLESHYFYVHPTWHNHFGVGPFVAVQSGTAEVIEAIGMGVMLGLRKSISQGTDSTTVDTDSFNFGVGAVLDATTKELRAGVSPDHPAPPGDGSLTKDVSRWGLLLAFSFSF